MKARMKIFPQQLLLVCILHPMSLYFDIYLKVTGMRDEMSYKEIFIKRKRLLITWAIMLISYAVVRKQRSNLKCYKWLQVMLSIVLVMRIAYDLVNWIHLKRLLLEPPGMEKTLPYYHAVKHVLYIFIGTQFVSY